MAVCEVISLTKFYGTQLGIEDVSFEVHPGEVFGFLGANGAGKTTAMRVIMGLLRPTRGQALLFGEDATKHGARLRADVGYLPGVLALYSTLTAREYLTFLAGMRRRDCRSSFESFAERLDLDLNMRIRELSKGNQQKVGLVQALMHQPRLLVLDEPTSGLDPLVQREFEAILAEIRETGASVLFSSHVLSEVEHQADRVGILHRGHLIRVAPIQELRAQARRTVTVDFPAAPELDGFRGIPELLDLDASGNSLTCTVRGNEHALLAEAVRQGVVSIRTHEQSLEDVFFELIQRGDGNADAAGA